MDKEVLAGWLAEGLSLEQIGRRVGRHPSTVSYWLKKHGLEAAGGASHAPRGGIGRDALASLVDEGLSSRDIAARLEVSQATVRHWLTRHGLMTARTGVSTWTSAPAGERTVSVCPTHGPAQFVVRRDGYRSCCACRAEAVTHRRRRVKRILIDEAGGACVACGYGGAPAALHFHHVDPAAKQFSIGGRGLGRSLMSLRAEAAKCVLLCANCHAEVESGYTDLRLP